MRKERHSKCNCPCGNRNGNRSTRHDAASDINDACPHKHECNHDARNKRTRPGQNSLGYVEQRFHTPSLADRRGRLLWDSTFAPGTLQRNIRHDSAHVSLSALARITPMGCIDRHALREQAAAIAPQAKGGMRTQQMPPFACTLRVSCCLHRKTQGVDAVHSESHRPLAVSTRDIQSAVRRSSCMALTPYISSIRSFSVTEP